MLYGLIQLNVIRRQFVWAVQKLPVHCHRTPYYSELFVFFAVRFLPPHSGSPRRRGHGLNTVENRSVDGFLNSVDVIFSPEKFALQKTLRTSLFYGKHTKQKSFRKKKTS